MRRILIICLLLFASIATAATLQWNASIVDETHSAPTGYRIHRGTAPGVYDWQTDVGLALQWPIPDDLYGSYYWTASAYNAAGSSGYSNEVFWQRAPPQQYVGAVNLRASKLQQEPIMATDNFTDSNGTSLDAHDAKWLASSGGGSIDELEIYNNICRRYANWGSVVAYYSNGQPSNQSSQIIRKASTSPHPEVSVNVRVGPSSTGYSLYLSEPSGSNLTKVEILKNGSWLATLTSSGAFNTTTDLTLKIEVSGSSPAVIKGYVNCIQIGSDVSDSSSPIASGYPGFMVGGGADYTDATVDDWTDGISGGASAVPVHLIQRNPMAQLMGR